MGEGRSEEREGFFGGKYWVHFDDDGNEVGRSYEREGFFGGKYTEHHDESGSKVGRSEPTEGFLGGKYIDHYDESGSKVGSSEPKEGFFGGKYTDHYDESGSKVGRSERKEGFFGGKYVEGQRDPQPFRAARGSQRNHTVDFSTGDEVVSSPQASSSSSVRHKSRGIILYLAWSIGSWGGVLLANRMVTDSMLVAALLWLICLPGAVVGIPVMIVLFVVARLFGLQLP